MNLEIKNIKGHEAEQFISSLYNDEGHGIVIRDFDLFFVGFINNEVVASVRFCIENETPMLRTMRVKKAFQGQKVGAQMLRHFDNYLNTQNIKNTYCLPYPHLDKFYRAIGFQTIKDEEAPFFLQQRLRDNRAKGMNVICMKRE